MQPQKPSDPITKKNMTDDFYIPSVVQKPIIDAEAEPESTRKETGNQKKETMTDDFYIPPPTTADPVNELSDDEKKTRRNRVLALVGVLFIAVIIYTGDFPFGLYSWVRERPIEVIIVIAICAWYYSSFKPKRKEPPL